MKVFVRKAFYCTLCAVLLFTAVLPIFACAARTDIIKVAYVPLNGFFEYDSTGTHIGYGVELLDKISAYTGYKFEYTEASSREEAEKLLFSGKADMRIPDTKTSTSPDFQEYSDESIIDTCRALMTLKERNDLYYEDYENFNTIKVAVTESMYGNPDIKEHLNKLNIAESNIIQFSEYSLCLKALNEEKVDAVVSNVLDMTDELRILARFDSAPGYISMQKGDARLKVLSDAVNEIKMDDPAFFTRLYEKYYSTQTITPFTREEAEYIKASEPITVGVIEGRYPFSAYDSESGEISGIFVDLCELVSQKSGLEFTYSLIPQGVKGVDWLEGGNGRLISCLSYSALNMPSEKLSHSETLFKSSYVIIGQTGKAFYSSSKLTVALQKGFIGGQSFVESQYPNADIVTYDTGEDCAAAIVDGKADVMFQDPYVARYMLQSPQYEKLMIYPAYEIEQDMKLVMLKTDNSVLMSIINKSIASTTSNEVDKVIMTHTVAKPYKVTWGDTYYKYRIPIHVIGMLVLFVIGLLLSYSATRRKHEKAIVEKNAQLSDAYEQTRAASQAKGDFLARMSHEIRTPMNAIIGLTTLAKDTVNDGKVTSDYLDKIESSSKMLLYIINDVLDMSSIESGKLKIAHEQFNINQLISSLSSVYYTQCKAKGVVFSTKITGPADEVIIGDSLRLNQILMNLLSNAVKFTDSGSITLTLEQKLAQNDKLFMHITVTDTGIGMSEDLKARLWKPFEQADANTAKSYGGSGLGLAIVKNLVTLMGGVIDVKSSPGMGTSFIVDLPFERCEQAAVAPDGSLKNLHVLAVDDDKDSLDYISSVLRKIGVKFSAVSSGKEALSIMETAKNEGAPFNVCIIDWKMPGMNGVETTQKIREIFKDDTVVIIASAYDYSAISDNEYNNSGVDKFVSKPLFPSMMYDTLLSLPMVGTTKQTTDKINYHFDNKRVLLAEDNDLNRIVAVGFLKKGGIECDTAENGKKAVDKFLNSPPDTYDAVLMDMEMPVMNGIDAAKAIRSSNHLRSKTIPIIAMTANAFTGDIAKCLQNGMNDHIAKPIVLDAMFNTLDKAFKAEEAQNNE